MDVIQQVIYINGNKKQIEMAIEECAELIVVLQHYNRGRVSKKEVQTEIADVQIMIDQMKYIFGVEGVNEQIAFKLNRLKKS